MTVDDAALDRLERGVSTLVEEVKGLRRSWFWMKAAAALAALVLVFVGFNFQYSTHQADCTRSWVNSYSARVTALLPAATAKNKALDNLIRTVKPVAGETQANAQARFDNALTAYLQASDAFNQISAQNPAPLAPGFTC